MLTEAFTAAVADDAFRAEIGAAIRSRLAKLLVERMGGEVEKAVNRLKSDPATRARITLAIDGAVASLVKS